MLKVRRNLFKYINNNTQNNKNPNIKLIKLKY